MISFLNFLFLSTALLEMLLAWQVYVVFRQQRDASARAWIAGCLLMATGMALLTIRAALPTVVSYGVINFIMLYALSLHGHSFRLLAEPNARQPRLELVLCLAYGVLQWGLSLTHWQAHLSLVAALCWTAMHVYLLMRLRPLADRLGSAHFKVYLYLLAVGLGLWLLRVLVVFGDGIALASDPRLINALSIASVNLVLIAQQISYLVVRLTHEKHQKEQSDGRHGSLQKAWQDQQTVLQAKQEEREQLLRDLHDGFGSKLASLRLLVQTQRLTHPQINDYLRELSADLNLFLDTLCHDELTLEQALIDMRYRTESRFADGGPQLQWQMQLQDMPPMAARSALHVLRVLQEAMHNAIRHAQARHILLNVDYNSALKRLTVSVQDDGIGMPQELRKGHGLNSMQQRAREIGAQLLWRGTAAGTEVCLTLQH